MSPLTNVGKGESTFEVLGLTITLRALTGDEEIEVQRAARSSLPAEGEVTDQVAMLEYLDKFRNGSLGYAIVQVGKLDFRNVEFVETGAKLANGQAVKIRKHEAVQQVVAKWSRSMTVAVFKKFGELMNSVEKEVDALIAFDPVDYDAEISRLEERIRELKDDKARSEAADLDPRSNVRNQVMNASAKAKAKAASDVSEQLNTNVESDSVHVPSDEEREVAEETYESEEIGDTEDFSPSSEPEVEEPPPPAEPTPRKPVYAREEPPVRPPPGRPSSASSTPPGPTSEPVRSSMVDLDDPDSAKDEMAAETQRILAMKAAAAKKAPHFAARAAAASFDPAQASKAIGNVPQKEVGRETNPFGTKETAAPTQVEQPRLAGEMHGKEVYSMPEQVMTDRGRIAPVSPVVPPVQSSPQNVNPRFKPAKK
jgi:hypothetical protein